MPSIELSGPENPSGRADPKLLLPRMGYLIVGPSRKVYAVHPEVISRSGMLNTLDGRATDSGRRGMVLETWKEDEAERLVEWLYHNDYSSPTPTPLEKTSLSERKSVNPCYRLQTDINHLAIESDASQQPLRDLEYVRYLDYGPVRAGGLTGAEIFKLWAIRNGSQPSGDMDYGPTLLCHARLYWKAFYLDLEALRGHAYRRLQAVLLSVTRIRKDSLFVSNFKNLIEYTYRRTSRGDQMRNLLSTFMAMHIDSLNVRLKNPAILRDVLGKIQQLSLLGEKSILPKSEDETISENHDHPAVMNQCPEATDNNGQDHHKIKEDFKPKNPTLHDTEPDIEYDDSSDDGAYDDEDGAPEPYTPNLDGSRNRGQSNTHFYQPPISLPQESLALQPLTGAASVSIGSNVGQTNQMMVESAGETQTTCRSLPQKYHLRNMERVFRYNSNS